MVTSTPVAATFESSALPQFPLVTAFTELPCNPHPATITAFEELPSKTTKHTGGAALSDQIAKPDGQPGRPGSGRYNLADALSEFGWDTKAFKKLKVSLIFTRLILLC